MLVNLKEKTYLHDLVMVVFGLCKGYVVIEQNTVLRCFFLPHHLCQRALFHQSHIRVEDLQGYETIWGQFVEKFDFL